jgi:hypothetical protein
MLPIYHKRLWVKNLWNNRDADFFMILIVIIITVMVKTPDFVFFILWVLLILVFVIYTMQELVLRQLVLVVQVLHALCLPQCFWQLERVFQVILKVCLTLVIWEEKGWARVFKEFQAFWWPRPRICRAFWILSWNLLNNYNNHHTFFFCLLFMMLLLWLLLDGFMVYFKRFLNKNSLCSLSLSAWVILVFLLFHCTYGLVIGISSSSPTSSNRGSYPYASPL